MNNSSLTNSGDLVAAVEALALGEVWAPPLAAAGAAVAADRATAAEALFAPELMAAADAYAAFQFYAGRIGPARYGTQLATLHQRALASFPDLARLLRSADIVEDVGAAAAGLAHPMTELETHAAAGARAAAAARCEYERAIAHQLADIPKHELAAEARALLVAEDLAARLAAARARHEAYAAAELERVDAEQQAAARAIAAESARRVREADAAEAEAAAAAVRAANDARLARADALVARLRARLESAARTKDHARRIELRHLRTTETLHDVEGVIANARGLSAERIAWFTAALDQAQ